jgi:hydrogenase nickel incorporation protein HypA/HybF
MHELSIADAILDAVRSEVDKHPGAHVTKVGVRIGALSGVEPEALSFGFTALVQGTDLEPLELVIEPVPRRQRCPPCDFTFEVTEDNLVCPRCGNTETQLAGGDELNMAYLELEEQ